MMTLEDAIKHCEEKSVGGDACSLEHIQLKQWLCELDRYRKSVEIAKFIYKSPDSTEDERNTAYTIFGDVVKASAT